jgi:Tol biopolymer transport system component
MNRGGVLVAGVALAVLAAGSKAATTAAPPGSDVEPQVSPNGRYVLFRRVYPGSRYTPGSQALMVANDGGGGERVLVGVTERRFGASWGPGGFVSVTREGRTQLLRPEDGAPVRTSAVPEDPAWSPNGRYAAYSTGRRLWVANAGGTGAHVVAASHRLGWIKVGAWSPDSTRVTYALDLPGRDRSASEVVRADGTARHRLKVAPVVGAGSWAPTGRAVVLVAQGNPRRPTRYEPPHLFVVRPDGARARLLVRGYGTGAAWSPSGRRIAYVRQIRGRGNAVDRWDLMLVRPDGSARQRITGLVYGASPVWFPDARRIAIFGTGRCPRVGIYSVDLVRRTAKRLTNRC